MEGRCIFVFFMIFNAILGLSGIILLIGGIITATQSGANTSFIASIVLGVYIITILVLGACSWKKTGVLIAYFVLTILLILSEIAVIVIFKVTANKFTPSAIGTGVDLALIVFGISLGIAFLSFLFSAIYFCLMRKEDGPQLYSDVKNMEYTNMPSYQNV